MKAKTERLGYTAENNNSMIAYHRDFPMGREIDLNRTSLREIAGQGWVGNPGYLGIGVEEFGWDAESVAQAKSEFEAGSTEAFNFAKYDNIEQTRERQAKQQLTQAENDELSRAQRVADAPGIITEAQTAEERENDLTSDAMKVRRKDKGLPQNFDGALRQQERAKELEAEGETKISVDEAGILLAHDENKSEQVVSRPPPPNLDDAAQAFAIRRNTLIESAAAMGVTLSDITMIIPTGTVDIDAMTEADYVNAMDLIEGHVNQPPVPKRRGKKDA